MKFTFKTEKPTGQYKAFFDPRYIIKLKGFIVGAIEPQSPFRARFMVEKSDIMEDGNSNCSWKWIKLTKEFDSVDKTKQWLNDNTDLIIEKYPLLKQQ